VKQTASIQSASLSHAFNLTNSICAQTVVSDGVGLAYSINKRHCIFNITALREHDWTDKLSQLLEEALLEMRTLIEIDKPPTSKL
jgi:hypothetical protein